MPVGEYAGIALQDASDTWRHGAVFLLQKPARACDPVTLNGWTTSVVGDQRAVITCGQSSAADSANVLIEALEAANSGLDYLSATGKSHSLIVDVADDCIVWWPDGSGGAVMRATVATSMGFLMQATGVVTQPDGTIVHPPPPPAPINHDTLRFMRMAKTSGDLFDAYRNCSLHSSACSTTFTRTRRGGEGAWFKAALAAADPIVPVSQLAPVNEPDPIEWAYQNIYSAERSGLVHAKQRRGYLLPHDTAGRANLAASLESLWRYVRELTNKHLGVQSGSGQLSAYGWAIFADPVLQAVKLFASEDDAPIVNDGRPHPLDRRRAVQTWCRLFPKRRPTVITIEATPSAPVTDPGDSMLRTISAAFDVAELRPLNIRKVGAVETDAGDASNVAAYSELTPLRLGESVSRFEVVVGLRNFSTNGPPTVFSS